MYMVFTAVCWKLAITGVAKPRTTTKNWSTIKSGFKEINTDLLCIGISRTDFQESKGTMEIEIEAITGNWDRHIISHLTTLRKGEGPTLDKAGGGDPMSTPVTVHHRAQENSLHWGLELVENLWDLCVWGEGCMCVLRHYIIIGVHKHMYMVLDKWANVCVCVLSLTLGQSYRYMICIAL